MGQFTQISCSLQSNNKTTNYFVLLDFLYSHIGNDLLLAAVSYETVKNVLPPTSGSENGRAITILLQDAGKQLPISKRRHGGEDYNVILN